MDKLQIIEKIIKYLPLPAFVTLDGKFVMKNEQAEKITLGDLSEKLRSVPQDGGALMWDESIEGKNCSLVAWNVDEYCILTVNRINSGASSAVARISRGIRQPLGSVHACTKILLNRLEKEDDSTDVYAAAMTQNIYRLMRLISNLDALSGFEEYNFDRRSKSTDMVKLIRGMVDEIAVFARSVGKEIDCKLPATPLITMADADLIELALGNLVTNSLRYSQAGTRITVKLELAGKNIVITVSDTGDGISPEKLQQISGMYFEWESISDMLSASAGIGIPIARLTALAHGGSMMIESRKGSGTNVVMTLPLTKSKELIFSAARREFKSEHLKPLVMLSDVLPRESYMYHEL